MVSPARRARGKHTTLTPPERRTLNAFCEALLPAGGRLPGAEGEAGVAVVEAAERLLQSTPRRNRRLIRMAIRIFERSTLPRARFSRLPPPARVRHIERMEGSRIRLRRDMTLALKTIVCFCYGRDPRTLAAVGATARCERGAGSGDSRWDPPAPALRRESLRAPADVERCDVVIVGSGAGGASAARVLAERGLDVIVLEEGSYVDAVDYSSDPLDAVGTLYRDGGLTFCEGRPAIPMPVGRCVGGTTVVNSGTCFRAPADVLTSWRDRHGVGWASELDAEFEQVERALHVEPVDLASAGRNAQLCHAGAEAIGASNGPIARNAGRVSCCSSCPTGCALDAKQAMHVSELPRAAAAGARVRERVRVEEIMVENGRAVGAAGALPDRARYEVRGRAVVLAGGALGTAELLLRQGLGLSSGQVGRNLRIHPVCWVGGLFDEEVRGWDGVMQSWYVDEWHERGITLEATFTPLPFGIHWLRGAGARFKERVERFDRLGIVGVQYADTSEGRLRLDGDRLRIGYRLSRADAAGIRFGIARAAEIMFAAGAREAYPQVGRVASIGPGEETRVVERGRFSPAELRLEAFHPMGTVRMGSDPRRSVVDPWGKVRDVSGLYVADASIFPTATRVNPMITIMACARKIAAGLADRLS